MDYYVPNRTCGCARCRCRSFMGPVVLVTLGVLFLLGEFTRWDFSRTWPILLIAIGLVKVLGSNASESGHVAPNLPDRLRHGFAPESYPSSPTAPPSPASSGSSEPQPPQEVNHV